MLKIILLLGLPDDLIEKGKDIKSVSEIEQNGDSFKVTVTTGSKVMVNSFVIGQESEVETLTGEKIKARPSYFCSSVSLCMRSVIHALYNRSDLELFHALGHWFKCLLLFIHSFKMCLFNMPCY